MNRIVIAAAASVALTASYASAITVDGTAEAGYGAPLSIQNIQTNFGDSNLGNVSNANGSELDQTFATVQGGVLYLTFAGNQETNGNRFDIFVDSIAGGQNAVSGLTGFAATRNGLTFDTGFAADRLFAVNTGGGNFFVDASTLTTGGGGTASYLGTSGGATTIGGALTGGTNPDGFAGTFNNINTAGVTGGTGASSGAGVTTGIEVAIPLSALGNPAVGSVLKITGFVTNVPGDFLANQVTGGLPSGTGNLGNPTGVNFANITGDQFISITVPNVPEPTTLAALAGAGIVALRRRK